MDDKLDTILKLASGEVIKKDSGINNMCIIERDILINCIIESECYSNFKKFDYCLKDLIPKECFILRKEYYNCRELGVSWRELIGENVLE